MSRPHDRWLYHESGAGLEEYAAAVRCTLGLVLGFLFAMVGSCLGVHHASASEPSKNAGISRDSRELDPRVRLSMLARDPARSRDRDEVDAFAREVDSMPDGETRVAADLFLAELYVRRFSAPETALVRYRRALGSPALDPLTRRLAEGGFVDALILTNQRREAYEVAHRSGDAQLVKRARAALERAALHVGSVAALLSFTVMALTCVAMALRGGRRDGKAVAQSVLGFARSAVPFAAWLGGGGALLARAYDQSSALPFVALAIAFLPLALLARAWNSIGRPTTAARSLRAGFAALATLGGAFLVLETIDARLLEGFGL